MKEWVITFVDQKGESSSVLLVSQDRPGIEDAARRVRGHLFPIMDELDLNDFQGRADCPTAKWLKEQNGVEITAISERP